MRTILVDWLVELQENFELYHETLYLTVKLADHYLAQKVVRKEYLQLVGAAAMLLASKFEVCGERGGIGLGGGGELMTAMWVRVLCLNCLLV